MSDFIARRPLVCIYSLQIVSSLAIATLYMLPVKAANFGQIHEWEIAEMAKEMVLNKWKTEKK
jgi:hypothetical protein